jgi:hypothetical protein
MKRGLHDRATGTVVTKRAVRVTAPIEVQVEGMSGEEIGEEIGVH